MADDAPLIHQLVHGYARGHRLLASSTTLPDELAAVVDRASDAAPNYRPSTGPYLTGYPLPGGQWVLARTWPALEAERPNTVWTHSLLVPSTLLGRVTCSGLVTHLRHPASTVRNRPLPPIPLESLSPGRGFATREAAEPAAAIYVSGHVVLPAGDSAEDREAVALALWDQHWMPVRRQLVFCTAPDAAPFDARERSLVFAVRPPQRAPTEPVPRIIVDDLCTHTPFREWLHFVGSGERDPGLMITFARLFTLLNETRGSSETIRQAEDLLRSLGSRPNEMRRLKRRLLSVEHGRPRLAVPAPLIVEALAHQALGEMTAADDASLGEWIALAWKTDPDRVARILGAADTPGEPIEVAPTLLPARAGLARAFDESFDKMFSPATLGPLAALAPERVGSELVRRQDPTLWTAWASLPDHDRRRTLAQRREQPRPQFWGLAMRGTRHEAAALRDLLIAYPEAVRDLVDVITESPSPSDLAHYPLPEAAARFIRDDLATASDVPRIRVLARLASPAELPKRADWQAWSRAVGEDEDEVVRAIAYLLGRRADNFDGLQMAAVALACVYPLLATGRGDQAWERISPHISGDKQSWDRCRRLVEDFAKGLAKRDDATAARLLGAVHGQHPQAALALTDAVGHKRSDGLLKTIAHLFRI